jgi:hypothetical protein
VRDIFFCERERERDEKYDENFVRAGDDLFRKHFRNFGASRR